MELKGLIRGEAVSLSNVTVSYPGSGEPAIRGVNLSVGLGKYVVIVGPNGAGKTTLIETCLGLLKPVKGVARLLGVDTRRREVVLARRLCSYVPQNFMRPPHDHYTARQVILMGLAPLGKRVEENSVEAVAELLGIGNLLNKPMGALSGGEQQKVFIARALTRKPRVLFLDEPFASLDKDSRVLVARVVKEYVEREGATAVIASHDTSALVDLADAVVKMSSGQVISVEGDVS